MIHRREVLERDPPVDFQEALQAIRNLSGYSTADLCFVLNLARSTLWSIESRKDSCPNYENGRAILKLLDSCRNCDTSEAQTSP